jgi:hypothetical protein
MLYPVELLPYPPLPPTLFAMRESRDRTRAGSHEVCGVREESTLGGNGPGTNERCFIFLKRFTRRVRAVSSARRAGRLSYAELSVV